MVRLHLEYVVTHLSRSLRIGNNDEECHATLMPDGPGHAIDLQLSRTDAKKFADLLGQRISVDISTWGE